MAAFIDQEDSLLRNCGFTRTLEMQPWHGEMAGIYKPGRQPAQEDSPLRKNPLRKTAYSGRTRSERQPAQEDGPLRKP